jgi:hypothetical protein
MDSNRDGIFIKEIFHDEKELAKGRSKGPREAQRRAHHAD